jgi:hypothetical protein
VLLLAFQSILVLSLLPEASSEESRQGKENNLQLLHTFRLFRRRFTRHSISSSIDYHLVQPLIAAMRIVGLLAIVIGLDDDEVRSCGNVARGPDLGVQGSRDVLQQVLKGNL